jgi:uncharacterized membrane protein
MQRLTDAIPSRPHRLIFLALIAVNLLGLGVWLGDAIFDPPVRGPRIVDVSNGAITHALPDRDRKDFLLALQADPTFVGFTREALAADRAALATVLQTEPFDPGILATLLSDQAEKVAVAQNALQVLLLEQINALTPDERAAMAATLRQ